MLVVHRREVGGRRDLAYVTGGKISHMQVDFQPWGWSGSAGHREQTNKQTNRQTFGFIIFVIYVR